MFTVALTGVLAALAAASPRLSRTPSLSSTCPLSNATCQQLPMWNQKYCAGRRWMDFRQHSHHRSSHLCDFLAAISRECSNWSQPTGQIPSQPTFPQRPTGGNPPSTGGNPLPQLPTNGGNPFPTQQPNGGNTFPPNTGGNTFPPPPTNGGNLFPPPPTNGGNRLPTQQPTGGPNGPPTGFPSLPPRSTGGNQPPFPTTGGPNGPPTGFPTFSPLPTGGSGGLGNLFTSHPSFQSMLAKREAATRTRRFIPVACRLDRHVCSYAKRYQHRVCRTRSHWSNPLFCAWFGPIVNDHCYHHSSD